MTNRVSSFNAKTHFSNLLSQVQNGNEFIITKHNHVIAKLIPIIKENENIRIFDIIEQIKINRISGSRWTGSYGLALKFKCNKQPIIIFHISLWNFSCTTNFCNHIILKFLLTKNLFLTYSYQLSQQRTVC